MTWPKNLILDLEVTKIALVNEGADSEANIKIFKNRGGKNMTIEEIIAKMKPEHQTIVKEALQKAKEEVPEKQTKEIEDLKKAKETLETEKTTLKTELDEVKENVGKSKDPEDEEEVLKSLDPAIRAIVEKSRLQAKAAEEAVKKMKEDSIAKEAIAKAKEVNSLGTKEDEMIEIYKSLNSKDSELCTKVFNVLKTAQNIISESDTFGEVGASNTPVTKSADAAWEVIEKEAEAFAATQKINKSAAISEIIKNKPELYDAYVRAQELTL